MSNTLLWNANLWAQGNNGSFKGIHRQLQRISHQIWQSSDVIFLPNMQFECCMILQGTLGRNFDIFAASVNPLLGYSSGRPVQHQLAWGFVLWPNSRFSAFHLIRVRWLRLYSGKKRWDLNMKEEMRQIILLHLPSLMILMFLLDLVDLQGLLDRLDRLAQHTRMASRSIACWRERKSGT